MAVVVTAGVAGSASGAEEAVAAADPLPDVTAGASFRTGSDEGPRSSGHPRNATTVLTTSSRTLAATARERPAPREPTNALVPCTRPASAGSAKGLSRVGPRTQRAASGDPERSAKWEDA